MSGSTGRVIAIGDVHGHSTALGALLEAIDPAPGDTLVFLGDLVDRGPDSRGVLELVLELRQRVSTVTILGNHDEMMLAARTDPRILAAWLGFGGEATLQSYGIDHPMDLPSSHVALLEACVDVHETEHQFFAHGRYEPDLPLNRQPWERLRWESIRDDPPGPHRSRKTAILGHTSQRDGQILDLGHLVCIDTYCYGGGWLTALDVATGQTWQADRNGQVRPDSPRLPPR